MNLLCKLVHCAINSDSSPVWALGRGRSSGSSVQTKNVRIFSALSVSKTIAPLSCTWYVRHFLQTTRRYEHTVFPPQLFPGDLGSGDLGSGPGRNVVDRRFGVLLCKNNLGGSSSARFGLLFHVVVLVLISFGSLGGKSFPPKSIPPFKKMLGPLPAPTAMLGPRSAPTALGLPRPAPRWWHQQCDRRRRQEYLVQRRGGPRRSIVQLLSCVELEHRRSDRGSRPPLV